MIGNWDNSNCIVGLLPRCLQLGEKPRDFSTGSFPLYTSIGELVGDMYNGAKYLASKGVLDLSSPTDVTKSACVRADISENTLQLSPTAQYTVHSWINFDGVYKECGFWGLRAKNAGQELIYLQGGQTAALALLGVSQDPLGFEGYFTPSDFSTSLHMLTMVYSGPSTIRLYMDGVELTSVFFNYPFTVVDTTDFRALTLGARDWFYDVGGAEYGFNRDLHGIVIYDTDIGDARIAADYALGPDLGGLRGHLMDNGHLKLTKPLEGCSRGGFRKLVTGNRSQPGSYVDGVWVNGTTEPISFYSSVQPAPAEDLETLPEARRTSEAYNLFTCSELFPTSKERDAESDTVDLFGRDFEVVSVSKWQNNVINHYKALVVKVDTD